MLIRCRERALLVCFEKSRVGETLGSEILGNSFPDVPLSGSGSRFFSRGSGAEPLAGLFLGWGGCTEEALPTSSPSRGNKGVGCPVDP